MTFLIDEDVAAEIDRSLRQDGHGTVRVAEASGFRTDDVDVWEFACRHGFVVVTCNRHDFLELAGTAPAAGLTTTIILPQSMDAGLRFARGEWVAGSPAPGFISGAIQRHLEPVSEIL